MLFGLLFAVNVVVKARLQGVPNSVGFVARVLGDCLSLGVSVV